MLCRLCLETIDAYSDTVQVIEIYSYGSRTQLTSMLGENGHTSKQTLSDL